MKFILSEALAVVIDRSLSLTIKNKNQFITPEHILLSIFSTEEIIQGCKELGIDFVGLFHELHSYVNSLETSDKEMFANIPCNSSYTNLLFNHATEHALKANRGKYDNKSIITIPDMLSSVEELEESWAKNIFKTYITDEQLKDLNIYIEKVIKTEPDRSYEPATGNGNSKQNKEYDFDKNNEMPNDFMHYEDSYENDNKDLEISADFLTCISEKADEHAPVIGREEEINLTLQTLCRRDKSNPIHIGDPGVGKTALIYKLAKRINSGLVPKILKGYTIYSLDANSLVAGTRYRGDLEKRLKTIMEYIENKGNCILYLDDIHCIMGASKTSEGSTSVADLIIPYLDNRSIKVIGSTTYEDFKKSMARNSALMRRFHQIEIKEPTEEEAIKILKGLQKVYEKHHGVYYSDKAIEEAVVGSKKYISGRFLPDKAIDLIDEAGAFRVMHPLKNQIRQTVNDELIRQMIFKECKIDSTVITEKNSSAAATLHERISAKIFGQEQAVEQVVNAVEISKAGLGDEHKPMASFLFIGSTGVGKTELAKVLAEEMNINLVRFDMSEYTEKSSVAKFIGSPAGYVGYEDGGLLTDAIRKSPSCVLLLDEIEKAHQDIYNILLQVMDYGTLTDNRGSKADFKNVIIIMTSNAGAQYAAQASVGFSSNVSVGNAMMKEVKKVFKPEFINRLSCITIFNDMTKEMATLIMNKKLDMLSNKLKAQNIAMKLDDNARDFILNRGYSERYGAREMERTISRELKPLLTHEILYGKLNKGGSIVFGVENDHIKITSVSRR